MIHADRQTDIMNLIVAFCNLVNKLKTSDITSLVFSHEAEQLQTG